jgi:hypothetical protein
MYILKKQHEDKTMAKLITTELPAGKYYIGDLCYVMHGEWSELCDVICDNNFNDQTASIELNDGRQIVLSHTKYGDGTYPDNYGNTYGVDSGTIGAIRVEDIVDHADNNIKLGNLHTITKPFTIYYDDGLIVFDNICIQTNDDDTMGEYEEEDWDDDGGYKSDDDWADEVEIDEDE